MENSDRLCHAAAVVFLVLGLAVACTGETAPQPKLDAQPASAVMGVVPAAATLAPAPSAKAASSAR